MSQELPASIKELSVKEAFELWQSEPTWVEEQLNSLSLLDFKEWRIDKLGTVIIADNTDAAYQFNTLLNNLSIQKLNEENPLAFDEAEYICVGGGPQSWCTAAMLALRDVSKKIIVLAPDPKKDPTLKAASAVGKYRQSGGFLTDNPETLFTIQQFYDVFGVQVKPVESVAVFETEEDFKKFEHKVNEIDPLTGNHRTDLSILDLNSEEAKNLPMDVGKMLEKGFYPKIIIQRPYKSAEPGSPAEYGACNVDMHSLVSQMRKIVEIKGKVLPAKLEQVYKDDMCVRVEAKSIKDGVPTTHLLDAHKVLIATGPDAVSHAKKMAKNLNSKIADDLQFVNEIHAAPTFTYNLDPKKTLLHKNLQKRPMNVTFFKNGHDYAFGIFEDNQFRISLYDLEPEGREDLFPVDKDPADQTILYPEQNEIEENFKYVKFLLEQKDKLISILQRFRTSQEEAKRDFIEYLQDAVGFNMSTMTTNYRDVESELLDVEEQIRGALAERKLFWDTSQIPEKPTAKEREIVSEYASLFGINSKPVHQSVQPYDSTPSGKSIIGSLTDPESENTKPSTKAKGTGRNPEVIISASAGGGAFKFMLPVGGTDTQTELTFLHMCIQNKEELLKGNPRLC